MTMIPKKSGRRNQRNLTIAAVLFFLLLAAGVWLLAGQRPTPRQSNSRLTVATTIFPLADIVMNIGGTDVEVVQLLPPGASPHSYTLTPQQLADLQEAQIVFLIGQGLDEWAIPTQIDNLVRATVDNNIVLREFGEDDEHEAEEEEHDHEHGSTDPHYWLTVPNAKIIAANIAAALQELDPTYAENYDENLKNYQAELDQLEKELVALASQAKQKDFIAIHDAWSYFAEHYGFNLVATYEPVEGREPSLADLANLQQIVDGHNLTTFFTEPQKQSTGATRFLQEDFGLNIKVLDPIGGLGERDSYLNMMRTNVRVLAGS